MLHVFLTMCVYACGVMRVFWSKLFIVCFYV